MSIFYEGSSMRFEEEIDRMRIDPYYKAEYGLLEFTERVCEIHGQFKGIYYLYYKIFEWIADKMLWRKLR